MSLNGSKSERTERVAQTCARRERSAKMHPQYRNDIKNLSPFRESPKRGKLSLHKPPKFALFIMCHSCGSFVNHFLHYFCIIFDANSILWPDTPMKSTTSVPAEIFLIVVLTPKLGTMTLLARAYRTFSRVKFYLKFTSKILRQSSPLKFY